MPEEILRSEVQLTDDWSTWTSSPPVRVMGPEYPWEGSDKPLEVSKVGAVFEPARQLRDPCIFEESGRTYLLYTVAGEYGIAIAELSRRATQHPSHAEPNPS